MLPKSSSSSSALKKLNKNPNCNHNNNNIFTQPTYGGTNVHTSYNLKYDDKIQKKEDMLKSLMGCSEPNPKPLISSEVKPKNISDTSKINDKGVAIMNLEAKLKIDILQNLVNVSKSSHAFSQWLSNCDSVGCGSPDIDQNGYITNYETNRHPLLKVNLLNKIYFMVLLISRKIVPKNLIKVIQYFQNYYPQSYDCSCSICSFLYNSITENLKTWMGSDTNANYVSREFFIKLCVEYENRVKNFQITRITPNNNEGNQSAQGSSVPQHKPVLSSGISSALNKSRGEKPLKNFTIKSNKMKYKNSQPIPIWRVKPPEDKDKFEWKEKVYRKYLEHIAKSNNMTILEDSTPVGHQYEYFIGRGNNSYLVKQALKRRFWWTNGSRDNEWDEFSFIWTQWRRKPIIKSLKTQAQVVASQGQSSANQCQISGSNVNEDSTSCLTDVSPNDNLSDIERTSSSKHRSKSSRKIRALEAKIVPKIATGDSQVNHRMYNHME